MEIKAYGKINWYLDIEGQRADGYHLLKSIMQPIALYDTVILMPAAQDEMSCSDRLLADNRNLAYRAWLLMKERYAISSGLSIGILKNIPVAAGLGGGSADAAAVLVGVNALFGLDITNRELMELGALLGTDVPFAIQNRPAISEGIGTELRTLGNMPSYELLLLNPQISIPTKQVYEKYQKLPPVDKEVAMVEALRSNDQQKIGSLLYNALTPAASSLCPKISEMLDDLRSFGLYASMSGSGATVFGIGAKSDMERAYRVLKEKYLIVIKTKTL